MIRRLSARDHLSKGLEMKRLHADLLSLVVDLGSFNPKQSKICQLARRARDAVGELRSELHQECHRICNTEAQRLMAFDFYYGPDQPTADEMEKVFHVLAVDKERA